MITDLERFAFNQARFVFYTQYTIERDMIKRNLTFKEAFEEIKKTELGQKFLKNVSLKEMKEEDRNPGTFMSKNTGLGAHLNNEYGNYVEDFKEI